MDQTVLVRWTIEVYDLFIWGRQLFQSFRTLVCAQTIQKPNSPLFVPPSATQLLGCDLEALFLTLSH